MKTSASLYLSRAGLNTMESMCPGPPSGSRSRDRLHRWSRRAVWGLLTLIHAPLLVAVGARLARDGFDAASLGSALALAVTLAFFVLKLADAPFLRCSCRRATLVVFLLVTALVHRDLLAPGLEPEALAPAMVLVSAAGLIEHAWRCRRRIREAWQSVRAGLMQTAHHGLEPSGIQAQLVPVVVRRAGSRRAALRGPPVRAARA